MGSGVQAADVLLHLAGSSEERISQICNASALQHLVTVLKEGSDDMNWRTALGSLLITTSSGVHRFSSQLRCC